MTELLQAQRCSDRLKGDVQVAIGPIPGYMPVSDTDWRVEAGHLLTGWSLCVAMSVQTLDDDLYCNRGTTGNL